MVGKYTKVQLSNLASLTDNQRANGCAYFSALLILEANLIENPLHEQVDSDLQLTGFAINVLDKMSEASTIMAMKRMNVVAAELDRRARMVISEAREAREDAPASQSRRSAARAETHETGREQADTANKMPNALHWDWGNNGVEGWPSMDFSIVSNSPCLPPGNAIPTTGC